MILRLTFESSASSEEDNVDCVLIGSKPLCELVNIYLLNVVVFCLVFVVDQKDCFPLVINDTMADEC